ncbi:DNA cytosine methyltransferase [Tomitella gaofuii]|uniref:DNA cytosine methyltransferase n=1 Tax=Tomitella gaofuii TaxID=2760083 RepID=UPI0015F8B888|nr:DNA (cytosine-5-)-methyltransferase [Tomitella gaofuii]
MTARNSKSRTERSYTVVEVCAGAGGQALGLEKAGFQHQLAIELDETAAATLKLNRPGWDIRVGDVADKSVWDPAQFEGVSLLAGGVPCPPFSIAGHQLGASDERDLFSWAIEQVAIVQPRALMLENVRGLSQPRFIAYRQRVLTRLRELGYEPFWKLLHASEHGVAQLRPRFVLVALKPEDAEYFTWPEAREDKKTVGETLKDLMSADGWPYADEWASMASDIAPTLVGGSKKHGGADLGPTRAKAAWLQLGVDGKGIANKVPGPQSPHPAEVPPRLTIEMVRRLQGWNDDEWSFTGKKTSQYRQIGNAFPPPVANAVGEAIIRAFNHVSVNQTYAAQLAQAADDPLFSLLNDNPGGTPERLIYEGIPTLTPSKLAKRISALSHDFEIRQTRVSGETFYHLGGFRGFTGQEDHFRHEYMAENRSKVS